MKIYHAAGWYEYSNWIKGARNAYSLKKADLLLLEGGVDVASELYGEPRGTYTQHPNHKRDSMEKGLYEQAVAMGIPILGICRGSQLACILNGGRLVQHQQNPYHVHPITTSDGRELQVTSSHHQAQYPYNLKEGIDYHLLAWTEGLSKYHLDGTDKEISEEPFKEAELVYYPKTRSLAVQFHPEWMYDFKKFVYDEAFEYLDGLMEKLMDNCSIL